MGVVRATTPALTYVIERKTSVTRRTPAHQPSSYPLPDGETGVELTLKPELYREAFVADLPDDLIRVLAVSQRPFAAIFEERAEAVELRRRSEPPISHGPHTKGATET